VLSILLRICNRLATRAKTREFPEFHEFCKSVTVARLTNRRLANGTGKNCQRGSFRAPSRHIEARSCEISKTTIDSRRLQSDAGSFFRYDRIQDAKRAIELNRSLNYKHLSAAT
jgi:hypothetical protein